RRWATTTTWPATSRSSSPWRPRRWSPPTTRDPGARPAAPYGLGMTAAWNERRRRRARWLIVVLAIAPPIAAAISFFIVPAQPDDVLLSRPVADPDEAVHVRGVFRNLDAATGRITLN